jgi:hypothetical protein
MIAIRKMVAQGRSYKDIMAATNLPERTIFYVFIADLQA